MESLKRWTAEILALNLNETAIQLFAHYQMLLQDWNQKFNLTSLTEEKEILIKHFLDSLVCFHFMPRSIAFSLIDIGTGAGFPGIPLKIVNPYIRLTLVDSVQKKVEFCKLLVKELGLSDVEVLHARAEDIGQDNHYREKFDWSVARAVADLSVLAEYMLPLTAVGGFMLAMKGAEVGQEVEKANSAISLLGGDINQIEKFFLPENFGERNLILIKKIKPTPQKYPRKPGKPTKKPLL
ncbi:MAG: 16S rRNA (guanine(527)-N(7))-methyltransferase RsmG [Pelolinea sp.]|nr:16S rRNA (guanine(527)-N(7))-methyltransferase RsmG [Pelolinea sp.]